MISNSSGAKKLKDQKSAQMQQKEETLQNVLNTIKSNPKFIKLLTYSLNSLEGFVSPPNREIRVNAKIIIRLSGVGHLKAIATINITNEDVVEQTGRIIWKLMSINDTIDPELAKLFSDTHGHEAVIEILLSKDKGHGSKPYIKVLNGLAQVPQLVQKLIDGGLIETVKLVNDMYVDDQDVIALNFDTMRKISNQKSGREILIKKNLIPNLLKNLKMSGIQKDAKSVISGFTVIDNISRSDNGKEALKNNNIIENVSEILDNFENDDRVLKMGAKIYSKICTPDDMIKEIEKLDAMYFKEDYSDLKILEKSLVLISNFMLVDDICKVLCEPAHLDLLIKLYDAICKINLNGKTDDYIKTYVLANKYFAIVFNRINNVMPDLFEGNEQLYENINNSIIKNWEAVKNINLKKAKDAQEDDEECDFINVFKEYFSSYVDLIDKNVSNKGLSVAHVDILKYILNLLLDASKHFELDEKANFAASKILKIANRFNDSEIRELIEKLFKYMKGVVNTSEMPKTLANDLEVLLGVLTNSPLTYSENFTLSNDTPTTLKEQLLSTVINFMNNKPKLREANLQCLKIVELIMSVPNFLDLYFKNLQKNYNLIYPIISVMAKHLYDTSGQTTPTEGNPNSNSNSNEIEADAKLEEDIGSLGGRLLEKLVDMLEFRKMIKSFKEIVKDFAPATSTMEILSNLEFHLLYFFAILKIKSYFTNGLNDILEALKQLLRKEISFIEMFKKDENNKKNEKYNEILVSSSKRLNLEIAILKLLNDNCNKNFEESQNDAFIQPIKEVISTILEIFDKSSDSSNLVDLLNHLKKNIKFLLDHETQLNITAPSKDASKRTSGMFEKKFENVKFEDSVIEKITNILMNLLRKSPDEEALGLGIIQTFITLTRSKPETCNFLVKAGCPRLLLQIVDSTSNANLAENALELIKIISLSSEENLKMVSNQNILEKLHEIHTKFSNDDQIAKICDVITNELIKLPGQEELITGIIQSNIAEFHENIQKKVLDKENGPQAVLNNLEKINAFSSNKKQIEELNNETFLLDLNSAINWSLREKDVNDVSEKLLMNEMALLKKINEDLKFEQPCDCSKREAIINSLLGLMKEKSFYRDIYLNAAKIISDYINDNHIFPQHLKEKLDFDFVDSLFETSENYIDDVQVSKEINNILCNLCLRSDKLADYIVQKGGLKNVMEELKSIVGLNDEISKNMKLNGLKFLHSLVKDDSNMEKFLKANGTDLINNLIRNELNKIGPSQDGANFNANMNKNFQTKDIFNLVTDSIDDNKENSDSSDKDTNTNPHTVYCFKIINENYKKGLNNFEDPKLFKNVLQLLEVNYPNKHLFLKGMKLINKTVSNNKNNEDFNVDIDEKRLLNKIALSNTAKFITTQKVFDKSKKILSNEFLQYGFDEDYCQFINENSTTPDNNSNFNEIVKLLTFSALYAELNVNNSNLDDDFQNYLFKFYTQLLNFYNVSSNQNNKNNLFTDGIAVALMKLTDHFCKEKGKLDTSKFEELEVDSKLLNISLNYYKPQNFKYVSELLKNFTSIFNSHGKYTHNGKPTENYVFYLQNVYLRGFDFFDNYHSLLSSPNLINPKVEANFNDIINNIIAYYKIDQDSDIKVSSIKQLTVACMKLINHEKLADSKAYPRVRSLWEILYHMMKKDINNVLCGNSEVIGQVLDKLSETIEKNPDDVLLRDLYTLIGSRLDNNLELFEKIVDFIAKDIEKNPEPALLPDVEVLANLSKYPIIPKLVIKNNHNLLNNLKNAYVKSTGKLREFLSEILKNIISTNLNNEIIIDKHPDLIESLLKNILHQTPDLESTIGFETAKNEIDTLVSLLQNSQKEVMVDKNLITMQDIDKACELYAGQPELADKLNAIKKEILAINEAKRSEESLKKDKDQCQVLSDYVKEQFDQHMQELQKFKSQSNKSNNPLNRSNSLVRGSTNVLSDDIQKISSAPASSMSLISKTLFFNSDNERIKSPLSCKDNNDIPTTIAQILNLLRKLYNENKNEKDSNIIAEKNTVMFNLLQALKSLSISPDNHKTILEIGLMNFLEKLLADPNKPVELYTETLDVIKNCTFSESSIPVFIDSSAAEPVIMEVVTLYEKPELISNNKDLKTVFFHANMIFSNLCRSKKGFGYLYNKFGFDKLLSIGKKTSHMDILAAIIEMLVNYVQNHTKAEINPLLKGIFEILTKCFALPDKSVKLLSNSLILSGLIYCPEEMETMAKLDLVPVMTSNFDKFSVEPEFLNSVLFCLSKLTINNVKFSRDVIDTGLLIKLKDITQGHITNEIIIENITSLYKNLVINNIENAEKFCKIAIVENIFFCLENYYDKTPIVVLNCISCLDSMTISDKAITYLADTKFPNVIFDIVEKRENDLEIVKTALHCLGSYLYKEIGNNLKTINFEKLLQILIFLQKKHYSNSDILININYIAGYLIHIIKEKPAKEKLYQIISGSLKIQDWNVPLVVMTLKLMLEILTVNPQLIDEVFDDNMQCLFNLLKLYKDNSEIQMYCYKILSLFGKNYIYSYTMVNAGLVDFIKETLENLSNSDSKIKGVVFGLMTVLSADLNNAKKISNVMMGNLIKDLKEDSDLNQHMIDVIKLILALSAHKPCVEPFIQFSGLEGLLKILRENDTHAELIFDAFSILSNCASEGNDEYKRMMQTMKVPDLVNDIINKSGHLNKKIEFEGRSLIFAINSVSYKLDEIEDCNYVDIKVDNPIKTEVKNFLVNGKIIKMINMSGEVKKLHLSMSQDLLKISGKKPKSKLPPKPKYIIDTPQIKQIIKGHGTDAFKKSKGVFRSIPKAEFCFSIIGPSTVDGVRALNMECESEEEVNKWISYLEIVINYFKKTKAIKTAVVIKK